MLRVSRALKLRIGLWVELRAELQGGDPLGLPPAHCILYSLRGQSSCRAFGRTFAELRGVSSGAPCRAPCTAYPWARSRSCRSRSDFAYYPVPVLVVYHLMTSYYFYYLLPTEWRCRSDVDQMAMRSQFQINVSVNVSLCHLSSVYSEALGPLVMRQSPYSFLIIGI